VQELSGEHSVAELCQLLGVARSGYYAWCSKTESRQDAANQELSKMIEDLFNGHKGRYGSPDHA
jgi:putative transposase